MAVNLISRRCDGQNDHILVATNSAPSFQRGNRLTLARLIQHHRCRRIGRRRSTHHPINHSITTPYHNTYYIYKSNKHYLRMNQITFSYNIAWVETIRASVLSALLTVSVCVPSTAIYPPTLLPRSNQLRNQLWVIRDYRRGLGRRLDLLMPLGPRQIWPSL